MKWIIMVLIMVIAILLVICYALLVAASDADERAEEMYRKWNSSEKPNNCEQTERSESTDCAWK